MHDPDSPLPRDPNRRAILRDRLYVPGEYITEAMLTAFTRNMEIGEDPDTKEKIYENFNHYAINYVTADKIVYAFNRGDMGLIRKTFADFEIIDERIFEPMRHSLKIRFPQGLTWREYQPDAIEALSQHDYGILDAPPRAGKTLMIAATICLEREKTIVFAHQTDLLVQLFDTFVKFTNLEELQKSTGKKIIGFADTLEDFDELDVVLCTKQTFDHVINKHMLGPIQRMFGSVWVDEVHYLGADIYSKLINRFWSTSRRGVTATPERKDGLDIIMEGVIGPVVHEIPASKVNQAPMVVDRINTGVKLKIRNFTKILKHLIEASGRNKLIVDWMEKDVLSGKTIIAVTDRTEHQRTLKDLLAKRGIECELFNGKVNDKAMRKRVLNRIRNRDVPILIAMRGMTTGLDVPRADAFYNLLPSSNVVKDGENAGGGGYEQQCTRVRTEFPGKTKCWVRDFVDDFGVAYACWNERKKTYKKINATLTKLNEEKSEFDYFNAMNDSGLP